MTEKLYSLPKESSPMTDTAHASSKPIPPAAQAIIDRHLGEMMQQLEEADFQALGVVVGVLCEGDTTVGWCVKDDVRSENGELVPVEAIVREIATGIEMATIE